MWQIGDWWLAGADIGRGIRKQIVMAPGWRGPSYDSCRVAGSMARRFRPALRRLHIGFVHHQAVAPLPDGVALDLLDRATRGSWSQNRIRSEVGRIRNFVHPIGGDIATDLHELIAKTEVSRPIVDPPWRVWTDTNKRGGSDRHYHSQPTKDIEALPVASDRGRSCLSVSMVSLRLLARCTVGHVGLGFPLYDQHGMAQGR